MSTGDGGTGDGAHGGDILSHNTLTNRNYNSGRKATNDRAGLELPAQTVGMSIQDLKQQIRSYKMKVAEKEEKERQELELELMKLKAALGETD